METFPLEIHQSFHHHRFYDGHLKMKTFYLFSSSPCPCCTHHLNPHQSLKIPSFFYALLFSFSLIFPSLSSFCN
uniref:Uncharacterized protein n=1 Tax=Rhizophora mucronata TaxID=61149 RepID=A0A2P2L5N9_RHIMU